MRFVTPGQDFVQKLLVVDPETRLTAAKARGSCLPNVKFRQSCISTESAPDDMGTLVLMRASSRGSK